MHKTILIGVIMSCFLLLVTPCINAVEYNEVKEEVNQQLENRIQKLNSNLLDIDTNILIDLIIQIVIFFMDIIEFILASLAHAVLTANNHNFDSLIYKILYLLHLINITIGQFLIAMLNLISSLKINKPYI